MAAGASGAGYLLSFTGTDSLPAPDFVDDFYGAEFGTENGLVGASVPATEHSVMCVPAASLTSGDTFLRLLETYPTGIVSVALDTWDLWNVLTEILPSLHDQVMTRDGKFRDPPRQW